MKQVHQEIDQKVFSKGVNSDVNVEIQGVEESTYLDAMNMRSMSMDGDNFAQKKIKGELLLYPAIDNRCIGGTGQPISVSYHCMKAMEIQGYIIEVWADRSLLNTRDPFIRINGKIVLQSPDFPVKYTMPIQADKNENCNGGEFYITNNETPPMVFSMKDLMLNSGMTYKGETGTCTQKYFDDFRLKAYTINIDSSLYKPAFIKSVSDSSGTYSKIFGTTGLAVGSVSYSYRYVTEGGDRSAFSPVSELIPVVRVESGSFPTFPGLRTFGDDPNIAAPSINANHIRIRYDNSLGFDFIEVRRDSWYNGDGIGSPPVSEILGSVDILSGVNVLDVLDKAGPSETQEILTLDDQNNQLTAIDRAKTLRYFNERLYLMNIGYQSKDVKGEIDIVDPDSPGFSTIQKIGKQGHKNTFNSTHYKSNMRGEKISTAVVLWDSAQNQSYALPIEENFQFPNRRDPVSDETVSNSYNGVVVAANNGSNPDIPTISGTHEVFDHEQSTSKSGFLQGSILDVSGNPYIPMHPTSQNDSNGTQLSQSPNNLVGTGEPISEDTYAYNPKAFGLNYYAMGYSFKGIDTSVKPIPTWASGFSVVQTEPAKRVVAQGMGYYRLNSAGGIFGANTTKELNKLHVYFPDLDASTGLSPQVIDSLLSNPSSSGYKLQLVSPLGFFTEVYSYLNSLVGADKAVDMITYNRVLRENGSINPTSDPSNSGINGYVGYGRWRPGTSSAFFNANDGNTLIDILDVQQITTPTGRSNYLEITLGDSIYDVYGGQGFLHENDPIVREWQEPMYVVNLVRDDAAINPGLTTQYKYTGHYIKFDSIVHIVSQGGQDSISAVLVSERWEDCVPTLPGITLNDYVGLNRFVIVQDDDGNEKRWMNVTSLTGAQVSAILSDISANGVYQATDSSGTYDVYGVYKHSVVQDEDAKIVTLDFDWFDQGFPKQFMVPDSGLKIIVRYDNRIPVRVFGGDTYINESVWAVKDIRYNKDADISNPSDEFKMNIAFPYGTYFLPNSNAIVKRTTGIDRIQDNNAGMRFSRGATGATIRQLISMWTAETRTNLSFAFNDEGIKSGPDQFFPLKNYVMKPYRWKDDNFDSGDFAQIYQDDNNIFTEYGDDYGNEYINWGLGGFLFRPRTNIDYSKSQTTFLITSVPSVGFTEQTDFCTRIIWSELRPVNAQNTPTVRTFPPGNFYDISDDTGEIKFAWSAITGKRGNNLYAFTDGGICVLLIDKRIISEINGGELATAGSDIGGIQQQLWIDRNIGMSDETWRSFAEYSNSLFFVNNVSAYLFQEDALRDIAVTGFKDRMVRDFIPKIAPFYGSDLTGGYNPLNSEYIFSVTRPLQRENGMSTYIYGVNQEAKQCDSSYDFDQYMYINNDMYGMKNGQTYRIGVGNIINGQPVNCYLSAVASKDIFIDKEFIRIRVSSSSKPEQIEFFDTYDQYLSGVASSIVDANAVPLSIKDYFGYECFIPRKSLPPNSRQQGRFMIFRIKSSSDENFTIAGAAITYKSLK